MSLCFFLLLSCFFFIGATNGQISDNIFCFTCIVVYRTTCTIHAQFSPFRQNNNERKQKHLQHTQNNSITSLCIVWYISFYLLHYASHIHRSPSTFDRTHATHSFSIFILVYFRYSPNFAFIFPPSYITDRPSSTAQVIGWISLIKRTR